MPPPAGQSCGTCLYWVQKTTNAPGMLSYSKSTLMQADY